MPFVSPSQGVGLNSCLSLSTLEISETPQPEKLLHQQQNAHADQSGGEPAAAVDVFMQQELGQDGGADVSQRRRGRRDEAGVAPGERGQQAEEAKDEAAESEKEKFFSDDMADHAEKTFFHADLNEVADALHGGGEQHVAAAGSHDQHSDGYPEFKRAHVAPSRRAEARLH